MDGFQNLLPVELWQNTGVGECIFDIQQRGIYRNDTRSTDEENIHIGRFIIAPRKTGLGLGTAALKRFIDFLFEDDNIKSISLTVFDFNQTAKRIYEKLGFEINEVIETPRLKYIMKKYR